jgi:ubiquinone/menaquinone biosynthesis C-methylase UbiE
MAFYRDRVYPHIVDTVGNPKPIDDIRSRIIPIANGDVLEIGVGPGVNFPHYDPGKVGKVFALEPNQGMLRRAKKRCARSRLDVEFLDLPGERIPLADSCIDTVVCTFTMCTIPGVVEALRGVNRVLKPNGHLIFFEHGLAPDPQIQAWQRRLEPLFKCAFEGCHLTRHIPTLIQDGGFRIEQIDAGYLAPFPKSPSYCWWGVAAPVMAAF